MQTEESKKLWTSLKNCLGYNANSGKSLVETILLDNGMLASSQKTKSEI